MPPSQHRGKDFVERHDLWTAAQAQGIAAVEKTIRKKDLELVRFSFCDQHGILRGKTLVGSEAVRALCAGVTMTSTLLAKDTSHRTVFPVFTAGAGLAASRGAGNMMMVADPTTFRVLPWAERTGWVLCDLYGGEGEPVPVSTRALFRDALARLAKAGFAYMAGLEVEFHLFRVVDPRLAPETLIWPAEPPAVSHTTRGYHYLTEAPIDQVDAILGMLRRALIELGLPLRSQEVEFGPSQFEFTFAPEIGMVPADTMVLLRSAMKQVAHRHGYLVSFMCRPGLPNALASGWHLHQSLIDLNAQSNDFVSY